MKFVTMLCGVIVPPLFVADVGRKWKASAEAADEQAIELAKVLASKLQLVAPSQS